MSYTTATVTDKFPEADGRLRLDITYTGDAGEPAVILPLYVISTALPSADEFRAQAMSRLAILNTSRTVLSQVSTPLVLDTTTPLPTPPAPPAPPTPLVQRSYMAVSAPFTPGATPQDVFSITGSSTKTVSVLRMGLSSIQTTAGSNWWHLLKRSTANTGGTSAAVTAVPSNRLFPAPLAATATVLQYTGNPTAGSLVGRVWTGRTPSPAPATAIISRIEASITFIESMPIVLTGTVVLIGTGDVLAWNFNGAALPAGLSVSAHVWWSEV